MTTAVRWFGHVNTNTVELERSLAFYRDLGLRLLWRTEPDALQDGAVFGRPGRALAWRGVLLSDHRGVRGPLLDLLEWTSPATGTHARPAAAAGFAGLVFRHPDVVDATEQSDPDGVSLRLLPTAGPAELAGVEIVCTDLAHSSTFYRALGFDVDPAPAANPPIATIRLQGSRDRFRIVLVERPGARRHPHEPYDVGIHRLALVTDRIDSAELPVGASGVHDVDLGPGLGAVRATCFPDPDGAVLEFVERGLPHVPAARE